MVIKGTAEQDCTQGTHRQIAAAETMNDKLTCK
jgi:hypothetical protein